MKRLALLVGLAIVWAASATAGSADDPGVLAGKVINGTKDGGSVAGLDVTLNFASQTAEPVTAKTDSSGQFRFDIVSTAGEGDYLITVSYLGVDYASEAIAITPESPSKEVELHVYDTTTETGVVRVGLDHHILEAIPEEQRLSVVNYLELVNTSDRTVVAPSSDGGVAPLFSLPEGAQRVEILESSSHAASLASQLGAILPGEHELALAYQLPYSGRSFAFRKPVPYPTDKAVFLMASADGRAESPQLPEVEDVESAAGAYRLLTGLELQQGSTLEVQLSGLPAEKSSTVEDVLRPAAAVLALLAVGGISIYVVYRRRRATRLPTG